MTTTTYSALLTTDNLKAFSSSSPPSAHHPYVNAPPSVASEEDAMSIFSDAHSAVSSTSTAPDDEAVPFTVQASTGESITVYESLEQAVRYSLLRADQERRSEEDVRSFAYAPLAPAAASPGAAVVMGHSYTPTADHTTMAASAGFSDTGEEEVDEDAYFSMG